MNVTQINKPPVAPVGPKRMTLGNVRRGRIKAPFRLLCFGAEKVGKSTFSAGAPKPIWLGKDSGTEHLDIERMPQPETWRDVLEGLAEVEANGYASGYRTLVVDPIGWLEPLAALDVTGDPSVSLATWGGGYGKGFAAALDRWRVFVKATERVWESGMNIIFIAHAQVKKFEDPEGAGYERYELALENKAVAGLLKQWVDAILFVRREAFGKVDPNTKRAKAYGSAARMLHTEWSPAYDAGNRFNLPPEMPLSWPVFAEALERGQVRNDELVAQIEAGLRELGDAEVEKKVRAWLEQRTYDVAEVANAVAAKLGERRAQVGGGETKEG